jgi:hypothetical protein
MATPHDRRILNAIVNPLLPVGEGVFDDENPLSSDIRDHEPDTETIRDLHML